MGLSNLGKDSALLEILNSLNVVHVVISGYICCTEFIRH